MPIDLEEVRHVAKLARLHLEEAELLSLQTELSALLGHFEEIRAIDVTGIEPRTHAIAIQNVWSEDEPGPTLPREAALRNSALVRAGLFVVPQIIED